MANRSRIRYFDDRDQIESVTSHCSLNGESSESIADPLKLTTATSIGCDGPSLYHEHENRFDLITDDWPTCAPLVSLHDTFATILQQDSNELAKLLVVLDCANIGYEYGKQGKFNAYGVQFAINYFRSLLGAENVNVIGFLPARYYRRKPQDGTTGNLHMITEEWEILHQYYCDGTIILVQPRCNDDDYIIDYAYKNGGFIVSNDNFLDHLENLKLSANYEFTKSWIRENTCKYSFDRNYFIIGVDNKLSLSLKSRLALLTGAVLTDRRNAALTSDEILHQNGIDHLEVFIHNDNIMDIENLTFPPDLLERKLDHEFGNRFPHLDAITTAINVVDAIKPHGVALKYLLFARAHALFSEGFLLEALEDLLYIIQKIDGHWLDALDLVKNIQEISSATARDK